MPSTSRKKPSSPTRQKRENVTHVTEGWAREIADEVVRKALRDHSRDLETHLKDIHDRLVELEKVTRKY